MKRPSSRVTVAAVCAVAVVAVTGTAIAATGGSTASPSGFLDSLAGHLGISRAKLDDAVEAARIDQVDALLAEGRITKEQADQLKERITSGELPGLGFGMPGFGLRAGGHRFGGGLDAAATYLGLTEAELHTKLADGKSLAEIAKAQGTSVDGLEKALVAATKKRLDAAVADGKLTEAQAKELLARYTESVDDLVQLTFDRPGGLGFFGGPPGMNGFGEPGRRMWRTPGASGAFAPALGAPA